MSWKPRVLSCTGVKDCYLQANLKNIVQTQFFAKDLAKNLLNLGKVGIILLLVACSQKQNPGSNQINNIKLRLDNIERRLGTKDSSQPVKILKAPVGPIKSITLRLGTKDDRLRIYWADGSNSDLPCTKEQAIWVCG